MPKKEFVPLSQQLKNAQLLSDSERLKDRQQRESLELEKKREEQRRVEAEKERQRLMAEEAERKKQEEEKARLMKEHRKKEEAEKREKERVLAENQQRCKKITEIHKTRNVLSILLSIIFSIIAFSLVGEGYGKSLKELAGMVATGGLLALIFPPAAIFAGLGIIGIILVLAAIIVPVSLGATIIIFIIAEIYCRIEHGSDYRKYLPASSSSTDDSDYD